MHENSPILEAKKRERIGSRYSRRLRDGGSLPAIVYGHKQDPVAVTVDLTETVHMIEHGERVFQLKLDGADPELVLLKSVQFDHMGTNIVHADFARVDLDERVRTRIHLKFVGEAAGLSEPGTTMVHPNTEIELECTLRNMPDEIEVDVSQLGAGETITASEVRLPFETMKLLSGEDMVVARVAIMAETQIEEGEEAEVAPGSAEPQRVGEKPEQEDKED